jgi:two-component system, NarL family, nitrate/nitrite response regulator NarL
MRTRPLLRPPYRVILVEDHKFVAEILAQRLSMDAAVKIVGIAHQGAGALELIARHEVDIVLLDMELEQEDGIGVAQALWQQKPELRIIGLSMHDADYHPHALLELGGMGFLSKRAYTKDVSDAIRRVANGDLAVSPQIAAHLVRQSSAHSPVTQLNSLTHKEVQVLSEIAQGFSVKQIAKRSGLTEKTIQTHRNNMRKKLHATTDVQLCLIAIRAGLIDIHRISA